MKHSRKKLAKIVALILSAPASALAQTAPAPESASPEKVETITVTAQKRTESIQEVPLSIIAVSGETLEKAGVTNPVELQKLAPALQINNGLFSSGVIIRIRGFGSAANTATDSDVATYLDSAFIPRPGAIMGSFLDVGTVEVLSGPQGTLFGRNAAMGAISISSKAPSTAKQEFQAKAEAGNFGTYSVTGIANVPVNESFALRLAAKNSHTDGAYHNDLDGKDYGRRNETVGRLSAKWDVTREATWTVRLDDANVDGDGVYPLAVYANTASDAQLAALTSFITRNGGTPPVYSSRPSFHVNQIFPNPNLRDKQYGISSEVSWDITPIVTTRLINSYRNWDSKQLAGDTVGTSLDLLTIFTGTKSKSSSHELQFITPKGALAGGKLGLTTGLYYFKEDYSINQSFNLGSQFCQVIFGPRAPQLVPACRGGAQTGAGLDTFTQSVTSTAGYVSANYAIVPSLELDVGVRTTKDSKTGTFVSTAPNRIGISAIVTTEGPTDLKTDDNNTSGRASLTWHLADQVMVFGTYQTGYKSGGFNSGATSVVLGADARTFKAEKVNDFELGMKTIFWDKLLVNATLFDTKLKNFQDRSFSGTSFIVRNSGDVRAKGLDLDGKIRIMQDLSASYGLTYLHAIYASNPTAPGLEGCTGAAGCPTVQDLTGQTLAYAPKWHANAGFDWKSAPFMGGYKASLAGSENYSSSFLTSTTLNPQSKVPSYATTDLRLTLHSRDAKWDLDLYGQNIFDKRYYVATVAQVLGAAMGINNPATGATIFRGFLGEPRKYGVRLSIKF